MVSCKKRGGVGALRADREDIKCLGSRGAFMFFSMEGSSHPNILLARMDGRPQNIHLPILDTGSTLSQSQFTINRAIPYDRLHITN